MTPAVITIQGILPDLDRDLPLSCRNGTVRRQVPLDRATRLGPAMAAPRRQALPDGPR